MKYSPLNLDAAVPILPRDLDFVRYLDPCTDRHLDELHPRTSIFNRNADHAATPPERRRTRRNVWLVGPSLFRGNMSSWCGGVSPRSEFNGSVARAGFSATTLLPLWPNRGRRRRKYGQSGSSVFRWPGSSWCCGVSPRSGFVIRSDALTENQ